MFSVWLHFVAAAVWVGGMVFLGLVLVPMVKKPQYRAEAMELIRQTGLRFRWVGWGCLLLLIATGTFNAAHRGYTVAAIWDAWVQRGGLARVLGIKLALVACVLFLSAIHDFYVGPRATARGGAEMNGGAGLRRLASWIGRLNLVLALLIIARGYDCPRPAVMGDRRTA